MMTARHAERLAALDAAFVKLDRLGAPYVVGAVLVFERAPVATAGGSLDRARLLAYVAASLDRLPRYRQRLGKMPILRHPVWIDDRALDLEHHVRFLPRPGDGSPAELDALAGRLLSQPLDPDRPPWEMWFVDGLAGDRFAVIAKVHHCLVDGVAGVRLLQEILRGVPDATLPPRLAWSPERAPGLSLLADEVTHRARGLTTLRRRIPGEPRRLARALAALLWRSLHPASEAGINPLRIGHRRAVARLAVPMAEVLRTKRQHGVTVNDVVLAAVTGGVRRFLLERGVAISRLRDFRAMVPASTHELSSTTLSGNRVALMLARLPLDEPDAERRLRLVHEITVGLKARADEIAAGELLVQVSDVTIPSILPGVLALSLAQRGFNVVVTNIPGPPFPLYLLGARLVSFHPVVNLWPRQTFGVALISYDGTLHVAVSADPDAVPDLAALVRGLDGGFAETLGQREARAAARPASP
jgi:WS/DGAT/MGAT family acyltransferase